MVRRVQTSVCKIVSLSCTKQRKLNADKCKLEIAFRWCHDITMHQLLFRNLIVTLKDILCPFENYLINEEQFCIFQANWRSYYSHYRLRILSHNKQPLSLGPLLHFIIFTTEAGLYSRKTVMDYLGSLTVRYLVKCDHPAGKQFVQIKSFHLQIEFPVLLEWMEFLFRTSR